MQFTGLHDKNGKEIYEGDVRRNEYTAYGEPSVHIAVMEWDDHFSGFMWATVRGSYYDWMGTEVVGNIHENPELLA